MSDMKRLKVALRELAAQYTAQFRAQGSVPHPQMAAAMNVVSAAERAGMLRVEDPLQLAIKALEEISVLGENDRHPHYLSAQIHLRLARDMAKVALMRVEENMP